MDTTLPPDANTEIPPLAEGDSPLPGTGQGTKKAAGDSSLPASGKANKKSDATLPASAQAPLLYTVMMLALMGQMLLSPLIAPLSREMGLREWHIGLTISLAAIMFALTSGPWGRASQRFGVRPVLTAAMGMGAIALAAFALLAHFGMKGVWVGTGLLLGVILTRGVIYGGAIAALNPTVQTHLVTHTVTEAQRLKAVGGMGAVTGLSSVVGAMIGGALAAIGGLMLPLTVMPVLMLLAIGMLLWRFQHSKPLAEMEKPAKLSYFDPRVFPFLVVGLALFTAFAALGTLFGFIVQDRFGMSATAAASFTALYMVVLSIFLILAQAVAAPKLGWSSVVLMRRGVLFALAGTVLLLFASSHWTLTLATILFGFGAGLIMPGYNAGPTIHMSAREQGSLAGLIHANNGMAYAIAPVTFTALYGWDPRYPLAVAALLLAAAMLFGYLHPKLRELASVNRAN